MLVLEISKKRILEKSDLEKLLPISPSKRFWEKISNYPVSIKELSSVERDNCILNICKKLFDAELIVAGPQRHQDWISGWENNYKSYMDSKNTKSLIPGYYNKYPYIRFNSELYKVETNETEHNSVRILIEYISDIYLSNYKSIIELGAGSCHHICQLYENMEGIKNYYALDWSNATQKIASALKDNNHIKNISSLNFDFFNPQWDNMLSKPKGEETAIYSFAALEQIGDKFHNLFNFICKELKPNLIIHLEPIGEILPSNELLPYLSNKYFRKRNYLNGYLDFLHEMQNQKKIKIHLKSRMPFGSLYIEGYSLIVWSPI